MGKFIPIREGAVKLALAYAHNSDIAVREAHQYALQRQAQRHAARVSTAHDGQSTAKATGGGGHGGNPNHDPKTGQFASK